MLDLGETAYDSVTGFQVKGHRLRSASTVAIESSADKSNWVGFAAASGLSEHTHPFPVRQRYVKMTLEAYDGAAGGLGFFNAARAPATNDGCWTKKDKVYVQEQHGSTTECYDFATAKRHCEQALDCHAIASQYNVCGGKYRVTHGGPTFVAYTGHPLHAYSLDRSCMAAGNQYSATFRATGCPNPNPTGPDRPMPPRAAKMWRNFISTCGPGTVAGPSST